MCTVSVLLDADRNRLSMLKAKEQMLTHLRVSKRGLSDAVACKLPRGDWQPFSRDFKVREEKFSELAYLSLQTSFLFLSRRFFKNFSEEKKCFKDNKLRAILYRTAG